MDSEATALQAVELLRQRELHGQPVKARLKNESYLKNLLRVVTTSPEGIPAEFLVGPQSFFLMGYPAMNVLPPTSEPSLFPPSYTQTPAPPVAARVPREAGASREAPSARRGEDGAGAAERRVVPAPGADHRAAAPADHNAVFPRGAGAHRAECGGFELPAAGLGERGVRGKRGGAVRRDGDHGECRAGEEGKDGVDRPGGGAR